MPAFNKTNGTGVTNGTLYNTGAITLVLIDTGASLATSSGNVTAGAIKTVVEQLQPLVYQPTGTAGVIHAIVDSSHGTAADIQAEIRALGVTGGYDFTGATATTVGNITFAA
jgi:hypothetical protein